MSLSPIPSMSQSTLESAYVPRAQALPKEDIDRRQEIFVSETEAFIKKIKGNFQISLNFERYTRSFKFEVYFDAERKEIAIPKFFLLEKGDFAQSIKEPMHFVREGWALLGQKPIVLQSDDVIDICCHMEFLEDPIQQKAAIHFIIGHELAHHVLQHKTKAQEDQGKLNPWQTNIMSFLIISISILAICFFRGKWQGLSVGIPMGICVGFIYMIAMRRFNLGILLQNQEKEADCFSLGIRSQEEMPAIFKGGEYFLKILEKHKPNAAYAHPAPQERLKKLGDVFKLLTT